MALALPLFLASHSNAQVSSTGNLIQDNSWSGVTYGYDPHDCCSNPGGSQPLYNIPDGIIKWSYGQATVSQSIGIQNALKEAGTGLQVTGYNWSWWARNDNGGNRNQNGVDTLNYWVNTTSSTGQLLDQMSGTYNTSFGPTQFSGTRTYASPYDLSNLGSLTVSFSGKDGGFWAGLYGPEVGNVNISLNYSVDPCASDPLYSPTCPGFAAALAELTASATPTDSVEDVTNAVPTSTVAGTTSVEEVSTAAAPVIDAGGIEVSTTGELTIPGDAPKEKVEQKQAVEEKKEEKKVTVDYSLIAMVVRQATDLTNVMSVVNQSIMQSTESQVPASSSSGEEIAITTESVTTTQENTINNVVTSQDNNNQQTTVAVETKTTQQTTVQQTRAQPNEAASGGVSMNDFAKAPADFSAYQTQLADASFYAPKEIYKGQVNVDNRRAMKGLGSDRLHQEMVRQQYQ